MDIPVFGIYISFDKHSEYLFHPFRGGSGKSPSLAHARSKRSAAKGGIGSTARRHAKRRWILRKK
jgi:hypothetical protein